MNERSGPDWLPRNDPVEPTDGRWYFAAVSETLSFFWVGVLPATGALSVPTSGLAGGFRRVGPVVVPVVPVAPVVVAAAAAVVTVMDVVDIVDVVVAGIRA